MRGELPRRNHRGRQRHRCPRRRGVAADGPQVQQGRLGSRGPSKFPTQIYRESPQVKNRAGDEAGSVYLESIDDEHVVVLVYDNCISRANPSR
jgi:hypothetical protein